MPGDPGAAGRTGATGGQPEPEGAQRATLLWRRSHHWAHIPQGHLAGNGAVAPGPGKCFEAAEAGGFQVGKPVPAFTPN